METDERRISVRRTKLYRSGWVIGFGVGVGLGAVLGVLMFSGMMAGLF